MSFGLEGLRVDELRGTGYELRVLGLGVWVRLSGFGVLENVLV